MPDSFFSQFSGIKPEAFLCLGDTVGREEVKTRLLDENGALKSDVVTSLEQLASQVLGWEASSAKKRLLGFHARQEVLRRLMSHRGILAKMPTLNEMRRQSGFYRKLDRAIQHGRMAFSSLEEGRIYQEICESKLGTSPIRSEVNVLAIAYEAWMDSMDLWDLPRLLRSACTALEVSEDASEFEFLPGIVYRWDTEAQESLEKRFWDALSRYTEIKPFEGFDSVIGIESNPGGEGLKRATVSLERWHSIDDAAESLGDHLAKLGQDLSGHLILLPDDPSVRRSVTRALTDRGIPVSDPRDPRAVKKNEAMKRLLLPLRIAARGFERREVIAWIEALGLHQFEQEIAERGIRRGFEKYQGGKLEPLSPFLNAIEEKLSRKRTFFELSQALILGHEAEAFGKFKMEETEKAWAISTLTNLFQELSNDLVQVGLQARRAPPRYWLERIDLRLEDLKPGAPKLKPDLGVLVSKLGQLPVHRAKKLWIVGLPPRWLDEGRVSDLWWSEREREVLSKDFPIRTQSAVRQEKLKTLKLWERAADEIALLDADYSWDGAERESLAALLRDWEVEASPVRLGAHQRSGPSFGALRATPATVFQLPSLKEVGKQEIRATDLDRYSRCAFQGLAAGRWRIWDEKEATPDLWPEVRGILLHEAIGALIASRVESGSVLSFGISKEEALTQAWKRVKPKGLLEGERIEAWVKRRVLEVLDVFITEEKAYFAKARTQVYSVEGPELKYETKAGWKVRGIPDRIDQHPDGFLIMDYKSKSSLPRGKQMVEKSYYLQLPYYAVAFERLIGSYPLGVQFVELTSRGGRGKGIFFSAFNGKEEGKLTEFRKNSASLFNVERENVAPFWEKVEAEIEREIDAFCSGHFEVKPKVELECRSCSFFDLCGKNRMSSLGEDEGGAL